MTSRTRSFAVETLISVVINTALSMFFVILAFHGQSRIPLGGRHGLVLDMAPQTFMVVLMSCLVPGLLARRRLLAGTLSWQATERKPTAGSVWLAAGILAVVGTGVVVGISSIALPRLIPQGVSFAPLLIGKALFGMLLAAIVTPWAIERVLR